MLLGSSLLPSTVFGRWQLGDVVRRAFADSGMSAEEWNAASEVAREHRLVDAAYAMREEAGA